MDPDNKKFGTGPREVTGAIDLVRHYKLLPHHGFFCKRSLPLSLQDTHYLYSVVGDTEIRKGEGMQLNQLIEGTSLPRDTNMSIQPFEFEVLNEAFQLKEADPVNLPTSEKGTPVAVKPKSESKDKDKKHKKHKDRNKDKEHKKHKHRHKDRSKEKDKEKKKDKSSHHDPLAKHSKKDHAKRRKHDANEDSHDTHKHKRSKHKSLRIDELGAVKAAGLE